MKLTRYRVWFAYSDEVGERTVQVDAETPDGAMADVRARLEAEREHDGSDVGAQVLRVEEVGW